MDMKFWKKDLGGKYDTNTLSNGMTKWYATDDILQCFHIFWYDQENDKLSEVLLECLLF